MILLYIIYGINYEVVHEVHKDESKYRTRNTLDCDQSNVYSLRIVFSAIS